MKTEKALNKKSFMKILNFQRNRLNYTIGSLFILLFAVIGVYMLSSSHATGPSVSLQADKGTLGNGATIKSSTSASDGQYVVLDNSTGGGGGVTYGTTLNPFTSSTPFNLPIHTNLTTSDYTPIGSSGPIAAVGGDFTAYAWPLYVANASTPMASVTCNTYCGGAFKKGIALQVPIPAGFKASTGTDAAAGIVYEGPTNGTLTNGETIEFWQISGSGTSWTASSGDTSANITTANYLNNVTAPHWSVFTSVTIPQLVSGSINHALNFAIGTTCSTYVPPAIGGDGHTAGTPGINCIPEGGRVQLDPSINVASIPGITPFQQMIAKALQVYGAYCGDSSGSGTRMGIRFEGSEDIGNASSISAGSPNYYSLNGLADGVSSNFSAINNYITAHPGSLRLLSSWNAGT